MKKYKWPIVNSVSSVLLGIIAAFLFTSDYMTPTTFSVTAIDRVQAPTKHGSDFYVVYRVNQDYKFEHEYVIPKGYVFDSNVSAATYSQAVMNSRYLYTTRPFDLKQVLWMNGVYFFGFVFSIVGTLGCFGAIFMTLPKRNNGE